MVRVIIFVEGQTEEGFVKELLVKHFQNLNIFLYPILLRTSKEGKGGISRSYAKLKRQIEKICKEDQSAFITTMIDYYGLPKDFPGKAETSANMESFEMALLVEKRFESDMNYRNFIANIQIHEFEALLFSDLSKFENWFDPSIIKSLQNEASGSNTPEHIDDKPETHPSARILMHCHKYQKPLHGVLIALDIGLEIIRRACKHFDEWLTKLESLCNN